MYVKGVSKVSQNGNRSSKKSKKRYYMVYYYDESGLFHSKRISRLQVPFYKMQICKQITSYCETCKENFTLLIRKNEKVECPNCLES